MRATPQRETHPARKSRMRKDLPFTLSFLCLQYLKKPTKTFTVMKNKLILWILSLLGFAAASTSCEDAGSVCEYGVPYATFSLKGKVTDQAGKPIPGISVRVMDEAEKLTDEQGLFAFENAHLYYFLDKSFTGTVEFRDIDGAQNGCYVPESVEVTFVQNPLGQPAGGWFQGDYTGPDMRVKLTETDPEPIPTDPEEPEEE